jgi:hypothetical protein
MSRGQKPDDLGRCQPSTMHVFVHLPHEAQQSTFPDARKAAQLNYQRNTLYIVYVADISFILTW